MADIVFTPVKRSDTLSGVAYFPEQRDLLIQFKRNDAVYLYRNADEALAKHLTSTVHPWSKFRSVVQSLSYEKISDGLRKEPLKAKRASKPSVTAEPKIVVKAEAKRPVGKVTIKATESSEAPVKRSPGRPRKDGSPAQPRVKVGEKMVRAEEAPVQEAPKAKRTRKPAATKPEATRGLAFSDAK